MCIHVDEVCIENRRYTPAESRVLMGFSVVGVGGVYTKRR